MTRKFRIFLFLLSMWVVAFGQPAQYGWLGLVAAGCGFALFFRALVEVRAAKDRFFLGTFWFALVQLIQLRWMVAHPYLYILMPYLLFSTLIGAQFGVISSCITKKSVKQWRMLFFVSALWTLMEWSRLFFMGGYSLNPVGLALGGGLYPRQFASLFGVFGMSFWVVFTNLVLLRAWMAWDHAAKWTAYTLVLLTPLLYGYSQVKIQEKELARVEKDELYYNIALVQTAFPCEVTFSFMSPQEMRYFVTNEWIQILMDLSSLDRDSVDAIVLPEYVVPFGTFYAVYPYDNVVHAFETIYGTESLSKIAKKKPHLAMEVETPNGKIWMVNNAFWLQSISNLFSADVVCGLADREWDNEGNTYSYSAYFLMRPNQDQMQRYEKRILLPMGEYIPFECCRELAAKYGVRGSFTPGNKTEALYGSKFLIGPSVCYEETFGSLMRESRLTGAQVLVNVSNDGWFMHSTLPRQHLEHSRLRTVELGVPLVRACNTGITCAVDAFGEDIDVLGDYDEESEERSGVLTVRVPEFQFWTPYILYGDSAVVCASFFFILLRYRSLFEYFRKTKRD